MALLKIHPKSSHVDLPHCCRPWPGHHQRLLTALPDALWPPQSGPHSESKDPATTTQTSPWLALALPSPLASGAPGTQSETSTRAAHAAPSPRGASGPLPLPFPFPWTSPPQDSPSPTSPKAWSPQLPRLSDLPFQTLALSFSGPAPQPVLRKEALGPTH